MCEGIFGRPRVQLPYGFPERFLQGSACFSGLMNAVSFSTLFHVARSEIRNEDEGAHFRTDALRSLYPRS